MPDNYIATILVGSRGTVNVGYVSDVRHDDYSIGSTIEHGSVTFSGLAPGNYYAYYLYDNVYIPMAGPVSFTIS
jgi:hypothetical protein